MDKANDRAKGFKDEMDRRLKELKFLWRVVSDVTGEFQRIILIPVPWYQTTNF